MSNEMRMIGDQETPIEFMAPDTVQHAKLLQHVNQRIRFSKSKMENFYPRWRSAELLLQAYIELKDYDQLLKDANDARGGPGVAVEINVPFAWAQINTIVTYLYHMLGGRNPIFSVGSYRPEQVVRAKHMEMLLQYGADYTKFLRTLYFFLMDGETYGLAVLRTMWTRETKKKFVLVPPSPLALDIGKEFGLSMEPEKVEQSYVSFEGNDVSNIDPFMFFPDPRFPMHEVNVKGEWVAWRAFQGKHTLKKAEASGQLKWIDRIGSPPTKDGAESESLRGIRAGGQGSNDQSGYGDVQYLHQIDQGTFEISPKDFGLGTSTVPEKWLITVANERQIIQCQRLDLPSDKHPVEVAEPNSVGYSFGQLGTVDILGPMQELMSWFLNSHIYNVRAALNNQFVFDPTKIEERDLLNPKPGKLIRMKNSAFGLADPKSAIFQLPVMDVTRSHISDFQLFGRMASDMTGATDNVRGLQDAGGRKTATEIRTSSEAATSRLASKGKLYSSMALTGLAQQQTLNYQALLSQEMELAVLGKDAQMNSVRITPDSIQGDFYFPVHDGTMPMDKIGLLDVWKEIFMAVLQDPELRTHYDVTAMFDWIAQLGGAQNISSFKLNVVSQDAQAAALGSGQGIPLEAALPALTGGL